MTEAPTAIFKTVQVPHQITLETARSLLVSAFEGGSNYWMCIVGFEYPPNTTKKDFVDGKFAVKDGDDFWPIQYVLPFVEGGAVVLLDGEEDITHTLTLEKLLNGFDVMARKYPRQFNDIVIENDDVETADTLLQCALFGEAIYG